MDFTGNEHGNILAQSEIKKEPVDSYSADLQTLLQTTVVQVKKEEEEDSYIYDDEKEGIVCTSVEIEVSLEQDSTDRGKVE